MPKRSAGLVLYRRRGAALEMLLVHPGRPFWAKRDAGSWSIAKGEIAEGEEPLGAARREFEEETGFVAEGPFLALGDIKQSGGKIVSAWAAEGDCDPAKCVSGTCDITWPPRSGQTLTIPEIDRCEWFAVQDVQKKIIAGQLPFVDRLLELLDRAP